MRKKISGKTVNELIRFREKEIQMLKKLKENRIDLLPQEEREHAMRVFAEIIQEIKEELKVYYGMKDSQAEVLFH